MTTKKLFNKGERVIQFDGGAIKPKTTVALPLETANRLRSLFADELQDLDDVVAVFDAPKAAEQSEAEVVADAPVAEAEGEAETKEGDKKGFFGFGN